MKLLKLDVTLREKTGRAGARASRNAGRIPAVVYGVSGSHPLDVDQKAFRELWKAIRGNAAIIELSEAGLDTKLSIIKDVQRDPVTDIFKHVDFQEVEAGKLMHGAVALHVVGEAEGVKNEGGLIEFNAHTVMVECLPRDFPEYINVDVTNLHNGQAIHISDLDAIEGVTFIDPEDKAIISCVGKTTAIEDEEPAEAAPVETEEEEES